MLCEICGNKQASFVITTEGAELQVCARCKTRRANQLPQQKQAWHSKEKQELELVPDYAKKVKEARNLKKLGRGGLAAKIGIKESILARIESGSLEPEERLIPKLERALKIKLKQAPKYIATRTEQSKPKTIGDIVELK